MIRHILRAGTAALFSLFAAIAFTAQAQDIHADAHGADAHARAQEPAHASEIVRLGDIEIANAYSRATLPGAPVGAGYMALTNLGETPDRLVSADSPVADEVQVHEMAVTDGIMTMRQLKDGLALPAGETVELTPGGFHIMFLGLRQAFVAGETIPVTLVFEKAGTVEIDLQIGDVAAGTGAHDHGHEHAH